MLGVAFEHLKGLRRPQHLVKLLVVQAAAGLEYQRLDLGRPRLDPTKLILWRVPGGELPKTAGVQTLQPGYSDDPYAHRS